jgi:hypothetical protein
MRDLGLLTLALLATIVLHSVMCRRARMSSAIAFLLAGSACGAVLLAAMAGAGLDRLDIIASLVIYAFACELYLFTFTFAAMSVSANIVVTVKSEALPVVELRRIYSGEYMASARLNRSVQAGLIVCSGDLIHMTRSGERFRRLFARARGFFDHDVVAGRHWTTLAFLAAFAVFAAQIVTTAFNGWTLTGAAEESLGYRYFYSLRAVYELPQPLFLPQGQILNLYHRALQILLTAAGYPPTQLFPRIDVFSYLSILGVQALNAACFVWMLRRAKYRGAQPCLAAVCILMMFSGHFSFVYSYLQPDYMALEQAVAWLTLGAIFETLDGRKFDFGRSVFFGVVIGFALSVKITLLVLPGIALAHAVLAAHPTRRSLAYGAFAGSSGIAIFLLVWFAIADFNAGIFKDHIRYVVYIVLGATEPAAPFPGWYVRRLFSDPVPPAVAVVCAIPLIAVMGLIVSPRLRLLSAVVLPASIFETYFLWKRDYPITLMEVALLALVLGGALIRIGFGDQSRGSRIAATALSVVFAASLGWPAPAPIINSIRQNSQDQASLPMPTSGERQLWLVPDNSVRPMSVHSAVIKGTFGGYQTLRQIMFPNFDYRFYDWVKQPIDLAQHDAVYFVGDGTPAESRRRIESFYRVDLGSWACGTSAMLSDLPVIRCTPTPGLQ